MINSILAEIRREGGRGLYVGGTVRDRYMGVESKDIDVEVYKLSLDKLQEILSRYGSVDIIGRSFGTLKIHGLNVDFSLPRTDNKKGKGHKGIEVKVDPFLSYKDAAERRDLTMNAMWYDPLTEEEADYFDGKKDIDAKVLRATDPYTFLEDPLRALRVVQFASRFEMWPDAQLSGLCKWADLSELSSERIFEEFKKLLEKGKRPSIGLSFMRRTDMLRFFPELKALVGCEQEYEWHSEGDVWSHTLLVTDEARLMSDNFTLVMAALCHDFGKPLTTKFMDGRIRSLEHEEKGVEPTEAFLNKMKAPLDFIKAVSTIVRHHLSPHDFYKNGASPRAFRRLARKLAEAGLTLQDLEKMGRADHYGRRTPDAVMRDYPAGDWFLQMADKLDITTIQKASNDVCLGRHLIARGLKPGKEFGPILDRCREIQDETGLRDVEAILQIVLENK